MVLTAAVKTFGRAGRSVRAVDGIDLSIGRGETVALLGRNGAGKSTTIGLLLGLNEHRSALTAAGIEPVLRRSGPPLAPQTEALLGWVVREAVTNVIRHSNATTCSFVVDGISERVRLTVTDDGCGPDSDAPATPGIGGTGLTGLTERLATAGGSLRAGPEPEGGFVLTAELPAYRPDEAASGDAADPSLRRGW